MFLIYWQLRVHSRVRELLNEVCEYCQLERRLGQVKGRSVKASTLLPTANGKLVQSAAETLGAGEPGNCQRPENLAEQRYTSGPRKEPQEPQAGEYAIIRYRTQGTAESQLGTRKTAVELLNGWNAQPVERWLQKVGVDMALNPR